MKKQDRSQREDVDMIDEVGKSDWQGQIKGAVLPDTLVEDYMVLYKYLEGINPNGRKIISGLGKLKMLRFVDGFKVRYLKTGLV